MNIRGLIKFSLNDFPGKMACVVFVGGCNLRCSYCHNPHLVFDPDSQPLVPEEEILEFLRGRVGKLDGVVISGGEPSLRSNLGSFATKIKSMGFAIKLDTNATNPKMVKECVAAGLIDHFGIDYKAPAAEYERIVNVDIPGLADNVLETLRFAVEAGLPVDTRTTVHRHLLSIDELRAMRSELNSVGITSWTLQQFNPVEMIDDGLIQIPTYGDHELVAFAASMKPNTHVRGLRGSLLL